VKALCKNYFSQKLLKAEETVKAGERRFNSEGTKGREFQSKSKRTVTTATTYRNDGKTNYPQYNQESASMHPLTSNSIKLKDCDLSLKEHANLKFSPRVNLCWYSLQSKFQGNSYFQSEVKVGKLGVCGRPLFGNPVTYVH